MHSLVVVINSAGQSSNEDPGACEVDEVTQPVFSSFFFKKKNIQVREQL